ncbi:MAG: VCBS repeat-containing protein [Verrucomicrobia bacterium]|nr:VCBS repeat-containing protein [Verrucomicrobiota bacterium]
MPEHPPTPGTPDHDQDRAPAGTVPPRPAESPPRSASTPRPGTVVAWVLFFAVLASGWAAPEPAFHAVTIATDVAIGYGVAVADVDGDRRPDILLADKREFIWFRNPGWERFVLAQDLTETDNVCLAAADLDGDGRAEIAVGAGWNPSDTTDSGAVFYLIAPPDRTQRWTPVRLPHEPTVHRMRWVRNASGAHDLVALPLHGRGNQNGEGAGVRVLAYRKPPDPAAPWPTILIDDTLHLTHNFDVVPGSHPPGEDLLVAAREGVFHFSPESGSLAAPTKGREPRRSDGLQRGGRSPPGPRSKRAVHRHHRAHARPSVGGVHAPRRPTIPARPGDGPSWTSRSFRATPWPAAICWVWAPTRLWWAGAATDRATAWGSSSSSRWTTRAPGGNPTRSTRIRWPARTSAWLTSTAMAGSTSSRRVASRGT